MVQYLEDGSYISPNSSKTIENLGKRICKEIILQDERFKDISIPVFDEALSPLSEFLEDANEIWISSNSY